MQHTEGSLSLKLHKSGIRVACEGHSHSCFHTDFHGGWAAMRDSAQSQHPISAENATTADGTLISKSCYQEPFVVISAIRRWICKRSTCKVLLHEHHGWTHLKYAHTPEELRHAEWKVEKRNPFCLISFKANKRLFHRVCGRFCLHPKAT